jgi:signal transduction histidine kinase
VRKHAQAQHVEMRVGTRDGGLAVEVADDGVGLGRDAALAAPGHRGLLTMQDRAAAAGGRCTVDERQPSGTLVTLWLPTS